MAKGKIEIASCQFAVGSDVSRNASSIKRYMQKAADGKAELVHFSECSLSGYAGVDHYTLDGFNWELLREQTLEIMALAKELGIWVILGSQHQLTGKNKPHNSLYLINPEGKIADRYDKRFLTEGDFDHYTAGDHFVTFDLDGVKCALLICFDLRFPELYRQLCKDSVQCVFQSFYNARQPGPSVHRYIMQQTMQCRAATNGMFVSMTNSSGYYCPYGSCFIEPDGKITKSLPINKAGLMINTVNTMKTFYDPSAEFRLAAINGGLSNSPKTTKDQRSVNRCEL